MRPFHCLCRAVLPQRARWGQAVGCYSNGELFQQTVWFCSWTTLQLVPCKLYDAQRERPNWFLYSLVYLNKQTINWEQWKREIGAGKAKYGVNGNTPTFLWDRAPKSWHFPWIGRSMCSLSLLTLWTHLTSHRSDGIANSTQPVCLVLEHSGLKGRFPEKSGASPTEFVLPPGDAEQPQRSWELRCLGP